MGFYINPDKTTKEDWLTYNGRLVSPSVIESMIDAQIGNQKWTGDLIPVCLVDNGPFTAAGIAYCVREAEDFLHPDHRPKKWYLVSKEALRPFMGDMADAV